jgi:hypothetical protein
MSENELRAGADYDKFIETAFKHISQKEIVPRRIDLPEEIDAATDEYRLQANIARENLRTIIRGQPALINLIIEELKANNDLNSFNKYFNTFKKAVGRITSITSFIRDWNLFQKEEIGQQLELIPEVTIKGIETISDMEKMSSQELDKLFREAVEKKEGKDISLVKGIQYVKSDNTLSNTLMLKNKDGIIEFDPIPTDTSVKDKQAKINNVKIRYIYKANNPNMNMRGLKVRWQPPIPTTAEAQTGVPLLPPIPSSERRKRSMSVSTGTGLLKNDKGILFKKKQELVRTKYH